jgi:hypothetical protein
MICTGIGHSPRIIDSLRFSFQRPFSRLRCPAGTAARRGRHQTRLNCPTPVFSIPFWPCLHLKALELFLSITAILKGDTFRQFLDQWRATIEGLADALEARYNTAVAGIVMTDVPSLNDVNGYLVHYWLSGPFLVGGVTEPVGAPLSNVPPKPGFAWNGVYGVVDIYGSYNNPVTVPSRAVSHIVDIITSVGLPLVTANLDFVHKWVSSRVMLGNRARHKAIYLLRGYDKAWSVLQSLRVITQQQGAPKKDPYKDWSARELFQILNMLKDREGNYRLNSLIRELDGIGRGNWGNPTGDVGRPPYGFRDRLATAAA